MRRRNVALRRSFTVTSASLKRSTGKNENNETVTMCSGGIMSSFQACAISPDTGEQQTINKDSLFLCLLANSHNLRSHQKIRHAEYQGEGVTITTVRKSRSSSSNAHQTSSLNAPTHSQASSLIISPPPPPNLLTNLNSSDIKNSLPMYKSD